MKIKITKEDILTMRKSAARNEDIEQGWNKNFNRVHRNKKAYSRKDFKRSQLQEA